jgi:Cytochrome C oxidase, cbb3-type, subunit III
VNFAFRIPHSRFRGSPAVGGAERWAFLLLVVPLCLAGCHKDMFDQPKYRPLEESDFFADGNSSRPLLPDTLARGHLHPDDLLNTGKLNGADATLFPFAVTRPVLERGRQQFDIFCSPCHGRLGDGNGMIVQRGFKHPPSFHIDRLREAPPGHYFDVITNGFGAMFSYGDRIAPRDRWAVIAYVRALQRSQHATEADVPPAELSKLERPAPAAGAGAHP